MLPLMCMCTTTIYTVVPFERRKLLAGSHVCESTNQGDITAGTTTCTTTNNNRSCLTLHCTADELFVLCRAAQKLPKKQQANQAYGAGSIEHDACSQHTCCWKVGPPLRQHWASCTQRWLQQQLPPGHQNHIMQYAAATMMTIKHCSWTVLAVVDAYLQYLPGCLLFYPMCFTP